MDETVSIERALWQETDAYGDNAPYWSEQAEVPCYRRPLTGSELVQAQRIGAESSLKIFMPFDTDVTTEDRLVVDGKRYGIDYIPEPSPSLRASVEAYCNFMENV